MDFSQFPLVDFTYAITFFGGGRVDQFSGKANFLMAYGNPSGVLQYIRAFSTTPQAGYTPLSNDVETMYGDSFYDTFVAGALSQGYTPATKEECYSYLSENPLYYKSLWPISGIFPDSVDITGGVPVFINSNCGEAYQNLYNAYTTITVKCTDAMINAGRADLETACLLFPSNSFSKPFSVVHDVYINGDNAPSFQILTSHNGENGIVTTSMNVGLSNIITPSVSYSDDFTQVATTTYDRKSLIDYTWDQMVESGLTDVGGNESAGVLSNDLGLLTVGISFKDEYQTQEGTTTHYSKMYLIPKDWKNKDFQVYNPPSREIDGKSIIVIHRGEVPEEEQKDASNGEAGDSKNYDGSDRYQRDKNDTGKNPSDIARGSDEGSMGAFHRGYKISNLSLESLQEKLWSGAFDSIFKVNENPIDNIISIKRYPFDMTAGENTNIYIGNISTGVNAQPISKGIYTITFDGADHTGIRVKGYHEKGLAFLDFSDTNISIFLPFIGYRELSPHLFMYKKIKVQYLVDIMTGVCKAIIYASTGTSGKFYPMAEYDGQMGIDVCLTASHQKQSEIANATRFATATAGVVTGIASGNPVGIGLGITNAVGSIMNNNVKNNFQSTSSNASISSAGFIECFIIYDYPLTTAGSDGKSKPNGYSRAIGSPVYQTVKLSSLSGFVRCYGDVSLSADLIATTEEKEEIVRLLQKGVVM